MRAEDAGLVQQPPRHGAVVAGPAADTALGVQQLQEIPGGHLGKRAASGRDEDACPADRGMPCLSGELPAVAQDSSQPGEPAGVAAAFQVAGQRPRTDARSRQPVQRRPDDVSADGQNQPDRQQVQPLADMHAALVQPAVAPLLPAGPAAWAPLPSHRCCQLLPGWSASQARASLTPRS